MPIKHNSLIENDTGATRYKPFFDYLKQHLTELFDFVITKQEIISLCSVDVSDFDVLQLSREFRKECHFRNYIFRENPYYVGIYHITLSNENIPAHYTKNVLADIEKHGSQEAKEIIKYWQDIEKKAKASVRKQSGVTLPLSAVADSFNSSCISVNYSALSPTAVSSSDGAYGTHAYKSCDSGRYYSIPMYDNYSHDSEA